MIHIKPKLPAKVLGINLFNFGTLILYITLFIVVPTLLGWLEVKAGLALGLLNDCKCDDQISLWESLIANWCAGWIFSALIIIALAIAFLVVMGVGFIIVSIYRDTLKPLHNWLTRD